MFRAREPRRNAVVGRSGLNAVDTIVEVAAWNKGGRIGGRHPGDVAGDRLVALCMLARTPGLSALN